MTFIQTVSGELFDLVRPNPDQIKIEDIAHALSNICRWTGHTDRFYSVAQHSVLASIHVTDANFALAALMHDASEAYLGDVSRPLKQLLGQGYRSLENHLEEMLAKKFGYQFPYPPEVKEVDNRLLETEVLQLLEGRKWESDETEPFPFEIVTWSPLEAEKAFLQRFDVLAGQIELDFAAALKKALVGRDEAMAKPLFYKCRECGKQHELGSKPRHGTGRGTKKRKVDGRGRSPKLPRGKRK